MLRSVGDLLRYIDENHLTSDFAAKVEYCQSDWIVLRTVAARMAPPGVQEEEQYTVKPPTSFFQAIETFAVTVKDIAQVLQGFGSELSETELPDEANAIEFLLHSHTHRYRQMKVRTLSLPCHGWVFLRRVTLLSAPHALRRTSVTC